MQLAFKATLIEMDKQVLLDFRLSRGDGIEFKRRYLQGVHYVELKNFYILSVYRLCSGKSKNMN